MAEALAFLILRIGIHGVVDHHVRPFRKPDKRLVHAGFSVFVVGQVDKASPVAVHPPGKASARVIGGRRHRGNAIAEVEDGAGPDVVEAHVGAHDVDGDRQVGLLHEAGDDVARGRVAAGVAGPDVELHAAVIDGGKERQAHQVVIMAMRQQQVGLGGAARHNLGAKLANARARIDDDGLAVD